MKKTLLFTLLLSLSLLLSGCGNTNTTDIKTDTNNVKIDKKMSKDTKDFIKAFDSIKNMDYTMTISGMKKANEENIISKLEYDADTKATRMTSNGMDIISTNEATYMQMSGKWIKTPNNDNNEEIKGNELEEWEGVEGITYIGEENCNKSKCKVYKNSIDDNMGKLYINSKTNLPYKIIATINEKGDEMVMTYDFKTKVKIEIPEVDNQINMNEMGLNNPEMTKNLMKNLPQK